MIKSMKPSNFLYNIDNGQKVIAIGICLLLIIPFIYRETYFLYLLILALTFSIAAASWDLTLGYSGVLNFAHIAFFGIGGYSSAILSIYGGISPWITIFIGGIAALFASLIVGLPSLRLKGVYIILFTFAFSVIIQTLVISNPYGLTGGSKGLGNIPSLTLGNMEFGIGFSQLPYFYFLFVVFFIVLLIFRKVINSYIGYAFIALRDDEEYAISRGINPYKVKLIAWIISSYFAGLFGALYAHFNTIIDPVIFSFTTLALIISYLIIGGIGTLYGPVIGTFVMLFISEYIRPLGGYRLIVVAISMIIFLLFARGGIFRIIKGYVK